MANSTVHVFLEYGHRSIPRSTPTEEGYTYDWKVWVRGTNDQNIEHIIEKVIFKLDERCPRPRRVLTSPPYEIEESGYANERYKIIIEIYFHYYEKPKIVTCDSEIGAGVSEVNHQRVTFRNPSEEFRQKLIELGMSRVKMGIDIQRFIGDAHEPFICAICLDVADNPIMTSCEHLFCSGCFRPGSCPTCRCLVEYKRKPNRILKQVYESLKMKCLNEGCGEILKLENYKAHDVSCPKRKCDNCGYLIEFNHNCVSICKSRIRDLERQVVQLTGELNNVRAEAFSGNRTV